MATNDFFSGKRFLHYAMKTYRENARKYLTYILVVFGLQLFCLAYFMLFQNPASIRAIPRIVAFLSCILSVIFVFREMQPLRNRQTAAIILSSPVSVFERYLLLCFNTIVAFTAVFLACFYLIVLSSTEIFHWGTAARFWSNGLLLFHIFQFMMIFTPVAIYAGGAQKRSHLMASVLTFVAMAFLLICPAIIESESVNAIGDISHGHKFDVFDTFLQGDNVSIKYTFAYLGRIHSNVVLGEVKFKLCALILLVAGYFRQKEWQIK